jgi:ABC-type multidrug transport system fused ATPase/permease subunit
LKWHDSENTGNKVQKIFNGTNSFKELRKIMANEGFTTIASIIGIIVVFFFLKPTFVIFVVVYFILFTGLQLYFNRKQQVVIDKANKALEQASGIYYEGLNNVLTLKTLGAKDSFKATVYASEETAKLLKQERLKIGFTKQKVIQVANAFAICIYLIMVGQGVADKSISVGTIFVFL